MNRVAFFRRLMIWIAMVVLALPGAAQQLRVDSVTVDSVWNSDSSWYNSQGILQGRKSRDVIVSFMPAGQGSAACGLGIYFDSIYHNHDLRWELGNEFSQPFPCGQKASVHVRVLSEDRASVIFQIWAMQARPFIWPNPQKVTLGIPSDLSPGESVGALLSCQYQTVDTRKLNGFSSLAKVWWDAFGDGTWDDSTATRNWTWNTVVPAGPPGQRRGVIAKARDWNGLWSDPETLTVQFGVTRQITFENIPGGTFQMGQANVSDTVHSVTISPFRMSTTEVTQEQYDGVMGQDFSRFDSGLGALLS